MLTASSDRTIHHRLPGGFFNIKKKPRPQEANGASGRTGLASLPNLGVVICSEQEHLTELPEVLFGQNQAEGPTVENELSEIVDSLIGAERDESRPVTVIDGLDANREAAAVCCLAGESGRPRLRILRKDNDVSILLILVGGHVKNSQKVAVNVAHAVSPYLSDVSTIGPWEPQTLKRQYTLSGVLSSICGATIRIAASTKT
jgi:hypothetical protein